MKNSMYNLLAASYKGGERIRGKRKMNIWQITWIVLNSIALGINLARQPRKSKYDFWSSLFGISLEVFILYKGGFF